MAAPSIAAFRNGASSQPRLGRVRVSERASDGLRPDLALIAEMIGPDSRVLDVGCGDGALLDFLRREKQVDGRGIELSQSGVNSCVSHGLSVIQGDADHDLRDYPTGAFDTVVLSQTLPATRNPKLVLDNLVRIGHRAIVSFPNFGFWKIRLNLLFRGGMPVTHLLPQPWYESPNIHLCTITDFVKLCRLLGISIERSMTLDRAGQPWSLPPLGGIANLVAEQGIFVLSRPLPPVLAPRAAAATRAASAPAGAGGERHRGFGHGP